MIKADPPVWPTEDDYIILRQRWRSQGGQSGPYASYGQCSRCPDMDYRYGKTYDKMICFPCFVEGNRPKKRRRNRQR